MCNVKGSCKIVCGSKFRYNKSYSDATHMKIDGIEIHHCSIKVVYIMLIEKIGTICICVRWYNFYICNLINPLILSNVIDFDDSW